MRRHLLLLVASRLAASTPLPAGAPEESELLSLVASGARGPPPAVCSNATARGSRPSCRHFRAPPPAAAALCASLVRSTYGSALWQRLDAALAKAPSPSVHVLSSCGAHALLENWLCSVAAANASRLAHVVVWAADACSLGALAAGWPGVAALDATAWFAGGPDLARATGPDDETGAYARFSALKAFMPYAVARLDRDAVTHDADAVWRRDVVTYLQPRGPRGRRRRRARNDGLVLTHNSNSSRCPQQINGGFVYALARSPVARRALSAWFGACANVVTPNVRAPTARRPLGSAKVENQPFLEAAVKDALYDSGASCGYGAGRYDVRVLDNALFQAGYVGASPAAVFFHANHRAGWRDKCLALRDAGALYVADCSGDGSPAALGACVAPGARHLADDDARPRREKAAGTSLVGLAIMAAELAMLCGLVAAQL